MKILNPSRFVVRVGDKLEYNQNAIDEINTDRRIRGMRGKDLLPSAVELNGRNPTVQKYKLFTGSNGEKYIELWVKHDDKYTGFSGIVHDDFTDIWCVSLNGSIMDGPHSLFKKRIVN
jgi:hypothetical protein